MVNSARDTAAGPIEIVCYFDDDDGESASAAAELGCKVLVGPRIVLTDCWNKLLLLAAGPYLMQGNDDIVFKTPGWDQQVEYAFSFVPDRILMVHGLDCGYHDRGFGPHPIVHRRWVDALGYFIPPYFESDFGDRWLNELADAMDRRRWLPFDVEHMHFLMGKAKIDQTTIERLERHGRQRSDQVWEQTANLRARDLEKLQALIGTLP
jgi:hypothetical protein